MHDGGNYSRSQTYDNPIARKIIELLDLWDDRSKNKNYHDIINEARENLGKYAVDFIELFENLSGEEKGKAVESRSTREKIYDLANRAEADLGRARRGETHNVQPANLKEFFEFYREKLPAGAQSSAESLGKYFNSLADETQQRLLVECSTRDEFNECITIGTSGRAGFKDVEVNLYLEDSPEKLLPKPKAQMEVTFGDVVTGEPTKRMVRHQDGKYFVIGESDEGLILNVESMQNITYQKHGKEVFLQAVHAQFKETTYSITDAIRDRNVDFLLQHHSAELLELDPLILVTLNYQDKDGHFGTLLHKAIDPKNGMAPPDFYKLYQRIASKIIPTLWNVYSNLPNEKGETISKLARERGMRDLPGEERVVVHIDREDTHTESVHKTVNQALVRLAKKMDKDLELHAIVGSDIPSGTPSKDDPREMTFQSDQNRNALRAKLAENFNKLKSHVDELAALDDEGLFEYLKPSLEKFEIEKGPGQKAVQDLKKKLPKIKNMLDDIVNHNRFHVEGSHFPVTASESIGRHIDLTYKEVLSLAYYSCQDESGLSGITETSDRDIREKAKLNAELNFLAGLYDVRRGYNIDQDDYDHSNDDRNRCAGGTVNSIANSLNDCHKLVGILKINKEAVKNEIKIKIREYFNDPNKREIFDQAGLNFNLLLWQQNKSMPSDLKAQFNSVFKDNILAEVINDYGSYLDQDPMKQREIIEEIYRNAIIETRITPELQAQIVAFDITMVSTDQLYKQLNSGLGGLFALDNKGYSIFLEYLYNKSPVKFAEVCERAVKENKLISLIDDDFTNINLLSEGVAVEFIKHFKALGPKFFNRYRDKNGVQALDFAVKNNLIDLEAVINSPNADPDTIIAFGTRLLLWAVFYEKPDIIEALKHIQGINPNVRNTSSETPLTIAARIGNAAVIRALKDFPGIDPNVLNNLQETALILAAKNGHADVIKELKKFAGINSDAVNSTGSIALILAAEHGHVAVIEALIDFPGVDPNAVDKRSGKTALICAADHGKVAVIEALRKFPNIDFNAKATHFSDETALIRAASLGFADFINALKDIPGIDPNVRNVDGNTALIVGACFSYTNTINTINALKDIPGIDPNASNINGQTALMTVAQHGQTDSFKQLLKCFYNIDVPDTLPKLGVGNRELKPGEMKLVLRSYKNNPVEWLLDNEADLEVIIKCAEYKNITLSASQKQKLIIQAAASNRPDIIERIIYHKYNTNRDVSCLNDPTVAFLVLDCLSRPLSEVAPSTGVNIMKQIMSAYKNSWRSSINKDELNMLNISYNEAIAKFTQYTEEKRQFLSFVSVDSIETYEPLFTQALLENDHTLVDKFAKLANDHGGITALYAKDYTLKQNVLKYADRTLSNIDKFRVDRQKEVLETLQQLGGGPEGSIFTKSVNANIVEKLKLAKTAIAENESHAMEPITKNWAAQFEPKPGKDEPVAFHTASSHVSGVKTSREKSSGPLSLTDL